MSDTVFIDTFRQIKQLLSTAAVTGSAYDIFSISYGVCISLQHINVRVTYALNEVYIVIMYNSGNWYDVLQNKVIGSSDITAWIVIQLNRLHRNLSSVVPRIENSFNSTYDTIEAHAARLDTCNIFCDTYNITYGRNVSKQQIHLKVLVGIGNFFNEVDMLLIGSNGKWYGVVNNQCTLITDGRLHTSADGIQDFMQSHLTTVQIETLRLIRFLHDSFCNGSWEFMALESPTAPFQVATLRLIESLHDSFYDGSWTLDVGSDKNTIYMLHHDEYVFHIKKDILYINGHEYHFDSLEQLQSDIQAHIREKDFATITIGRLVDIVDTVISQRRLH